MASATVRRRRLGSELRRLREAAGLTAEAAGEALECSHSRISRIELGRNSIKVREVQHLLDLYGLDDNGRRSELMELARNPRERNWWHQYSDLPAPYYTYIDLEASASTITAYEPLVIHGLLQTEDYARATVTGGTRILPESEVERLVQVRLGRQRHRAESKSQLWVILDESVLHRIVGGPGVMRTQLQHLVDIADDDTIIQVIPHTQGALPGVVGQFTVLGFDVEDPPAVYVETIAGDLYVDGDSEVQTYARVADRLKAIALPIDRSLELVAQSVRDL